jgi:hypothetical protein
MWFAKWFGGRDVREQYEEPTATAPVPQPAKPTTTQLPKRPAAASVDPAKRKGFDPYNSGTFERRNAWERVTRR